jgi:hypothetical protein
LQLTKITSTVIVLQKATVYTQMFEYLQEP